MHVVAAKPLFLSEEDVSSDVLENEREVLRPQAGSTRKSQMAIDKMVEGRVRKYFEEVVLLEQKFIVDDTINIKTLLNNLSKESGIHRENWELSQAGSWRTSKASYFQGITTSYSGCLKPIMLILADRL